VSKRFDGVDELLADARSRLTRVSAQTAYEDVTERRALLVDIRPAAQREAKGELPPTVPHIVIERNVLEWRLDPRSDARLPEASYDARVIVICQEGYQSSLAADALSSLGVNATDVIDGFDAWLAAGLPVAEQPVSSPAEAPGSATPS
jgi:rhodanese-related sulfurtransferase